jgi:hypothetical protein
MPGDLRIATAQFENRSGDKQFNLTAIEQLSAKAARLDANVLAFIFMPHVTRVLEPDRDG